MSVAAKRRAPHDAAVAVFKRLGAIIWLGAPDFSAKWLARYRPVWVLQHRLRPTPLARMLEELGILPRRYATVAHFDADSIVLTSYRHHALVKQAGREISGKMGVEIKVVRHQDGTPRKRVAA